MKKLRDIINECMDGYEPEYDDLRYAVCAMQALMTFDRMALMNLVKAEKENKKPILSYSAEFQWKERFDRIKTAYGKSPKEWLGENNDPNNLAVQERRNISKKIVQKILRKDQEIQDEIQEL